MLKSCLALRDSRVGMQENGRGAPDHGRLPARRRHQHGQHGARHAGGDQRHARRTRLQRDLASQ